MESTWSKTIERDSTDSPYIPKDFDGKIFLTYDTSNDNESIYYEWYIKEDIRTNNIKKITILDDLNDWKSAIISMIFFFKPLFSQFKTFLYFYVLIIEKNKKFLKTAVSQFFHLL